MRKYEQCYVCLEETIRPTWAKHLYQCVHAVCPPCSDRLIQTQQQRCGKCRASLKINPQPESPSGPTMNPSSSSMLRAQCLGCDGYWRATTVYDLQHVQHHRCSRPHPPTIMYNCTCPRKSMWSWQALAAHFALCYENNPLSSLPL
jgi:hypothetical protein